MRTLVCLPGIVLTMSLFACSVSEDERNNPNDPKYNAGGDGPDLVISAFSPAAAYTNNVTYSIPVTVKNQGRSAAGGFTVAIDTDSSSNTLNYALRFTSTFAGKTIVSSLAAGASTTVSISFKPLFTAHGVIGTYVDTTETVAESNENNNYRIVNVTIN